MKSQQVSEVTSEKCGKIEWPTLLLLIGTYASFLTVTWYYHDLPWWIVLPLGGFLTCLHGSLQHETVHGHPTRWPWLNELLIFPSLWLWMPFRLYRRDHLRHHRNAYLTEPEMDPESFYLAPAEWARNGPLGRALLKCMNTLLGRLVLGPPVAALRVARRGLVQLARGRAEDLAIWLLHGVSVALVLGWVIGVCGLPLGEYLLFFAYPGTSVTMLRSFLEHRAHDDEAQRTAVVEAGRFWSLLFLNNNLHALHHAVPSLAWYALPARYRAEREAILERNGGYLYRGYGEVFRRHFLRTKEPPLHPYYHTVPFAKLRTANDSEAPEAERVA